MSRKDMKIKRQEKISYILKKATESFSLKGYAGISTNEIADSAGISKRSMYYYMGDKDTLYSTVISEIFNVGTNILQECRDNWAQLSTLDKLRKYIEAVSRIGKNQKIHAIVLRELLDGGEFLPEQFITSSIGQLVDFLDEIIDEGLENKTFTTKINPLVMSLMTLGFFVYWKLTVPHIDKNSKYEDVVKEFSDDVTDDLVNEVYELVLTCLTKKKQAYIRSRAV